MRQIAVSTEVFSLIWKNRLPGEETEDQILKRLLTEMAHSADGTVPQGIEGTVGHLDLRSGTKFATGFQIFRNYKGVEYRAQAIGGAWILSTDGKGYMTLNQLSRALGIASENAWKNWYFMGDDGKRALIASKKR